MYFGLPFLLNEYSTRYATRAVLEQLNFPVSTALVIF